MKDMCCIDAFSPTSSSEIKAYFMENLKPIMDENRDIIFYVLALIEALEILWVH